MPALKPTDLYGTITFLGSVPHRDKTELETDVLQEMPLSFEGYEGDCHSGLTRPSCSRVISQHPERGTEIRNARQLSLLGAEDLAEIAQKLGMAELDPAWLGASVVIEGVPDFSHLPPSSRLQAENGTTLAVDMQNRPCKFPAVTIVKAGHEEGRGFKEAAEGLRGLTAWVERPGTLRLGDRLRLHVPDQRAWAGES